MQANILHPFLSPEPIVSWSCGLETRGSGSSRYRMLENFGHPVMHVQKLQISLLMLITDFCPPLLHWGKNFTCWALSWEWRLLPVLKIQTSQLGFIDNLEWKGEDINKNKLNTLLGCRTETIFLLTGRLSSEFNMWVHVWWKQTLGTEAGSRGSKVS